MKPAPIIIRSLEGLESLATISVDISNKILNSIVKLVGPRGIHVLEAPEHESISKHYYLVLHDSNLSRVHPPCVFDQKLTHLSMELTLWNWVTDSILYCPFFKFLHHATLPLKIGHICHDVANFNQSLLVFLRLEFWIKDKISFRLANPSRH